MLAWILAGAVVVIVIIVAAVACQYRALPPLVQLTSQAPRVRVLTYSDDRGKKKNGEYRKTQKSMHRVWELHPDVHTVVDKTEHDLLKTAFYRKHQRVLDTDNITLHAGNMQKLYFVLQELREMRFDEGGCNYLLYHDCSPEIWDFNTDYSKISLQPLIAECEKNRGVLIGGTANWIPGHTHRKWSSPKCMELMDATEHRDKQQDCSSWILIQRNPFTVSLFAEALHFLEMENCYSSFKNKAHDQSIEPAFQEHRGDQSVLSLLLYKHGMTHVATTSGKNVFSYSS